MLVLLVLLFVFLTLDVVRAQDPAKTDSDKYKVVLENERVRVLEYPTNRKTKPQCMRTRIFSL